MADSWMYLPSGAAAPKNDGGNSQRNSLDNNAAAPTTYSAIQAATYRDSTSPDHQQANTKAGGAHLPRIRRRNRQITSCLECRRRKLKCDKQAPCSNCTRFRRDCLYLAPALDPQSQQKLADIKEKMGALEKNLEREVAAKNAKAHLGGGKVTKLPEEVKAEMAAVELEDDEDDAEEDEDGLEPTPLAALDQVYEETVDDELMDLGVQVSVLFRKTSNCLLTLPLPDGQDAHIRTHRRLDPPETRRRTKRHAAGCQGWQVSTLIIPCHGRPP